MKSDITHSGTSLPESEDGPLHSAWQVGPTADLFLQDHLPASRSASQANNEESPTSATLHPLGSRWSQPSGLLSSLASRLQQQSQKTTGLMIYLMQWRQKVTPQGRSYYQLVASARRTFDNDSGSLHGWPTPNTMDTLPPKTGEALERNKKKGGCSNLREHVLMAGWPTPKSSDGKGNPYEATENRRSELRKATHLAGWPTPTAQDHSRGVQPPRAHDTGIPLSQRVAQIDMDQPMRLLPDGTIQTGSSAAMESGGQLNPAHSRWLMGYPPEWDDCADTAMPSSRKSRSK